MGTLATTPSAPHDPQAPVDLADLASFAGPCASWLRRVVAFLLDNAILAGLMYVAVGPGLPPSVLPGIENVRATTDGLPWSDSPWMIGAVIAMALLQAWTGATPGKRAVGIVVVGRDSGRPVGLLTTVLRWLAHLLDAILLVGYLRPLWDAERRTFADSLLSTLVVVSRSPVPHRWLVPLVREGRPGAQAVTASAVLVSTAGVLFTLGPTSSTGGSVTTSIPCTTWTDTSRPDPFGFSEASFSSTQPGRVTRWGVTHPVPPADEGAEITVWWDEALPTDADVRLEAVLSSPGGQERLEYSTSLGTDGAFVGTPRTGSGVIEIPANDLRGVGRGWTWAVQARVDGVATPSCGDVVPF